MYTNFIFLSVIILLHCSCVAFLIFEPIVAAKMGEGEVFGELALLSGQPRGATCTAMTDVTCLVLDGTDLDDVMAQGSSGASSKLSVQLKYSSRIDAVTLMR